MPDCKSSGECPNACKCGCKEGLYLCRCYPEQFEEES